MGEAWPPTASRSPWEGLLLGAASQRQLASLGNKGKRRRRLRMKQCPQGVHTWLCPDHRPSHWVGTAAPGGAVSLYRRKAEAQRQAYAAKKEAAQPGLRGRRLIPTLGPALDTRFCHRQPLTAGDPAALL